MLRSSFCVYVTFPFLIYCRLDFLCMIFSGFSSLQWWLVLQNLLMLLLRLVIHLIEMYMYPKILFSLLNSTCVPLLHICSWCCLSFWLPCYSTSLQLLFPTADTARPYSMLGLGDIVIPGKVEPLSGLWRLCMVWCLWFCY